MRVYDTATVGRGHDPADHLMVLKRYVSLENLQFIMIFSMHKDQPDRRSYDSALQVT